MTPAVADDVVTQSTAQQLLDQSREQLRVDFNHSLALATDAASIAERLGDRQLHGQALRAMANALSLSGNNQSSIEHHERAVVEFEAVGNDAELARTLSASIQPLILLGQYDRALASADRAGELFTLLGDQLRLARLDINVGNILHRQDRFAEAMIRYKRAQSKLMALCDSDSVMLSLHNQAVTLTSLNEFHEALAAYHEARRLALERRLPQAVAQADYNIAWLHYLRGEYSRAIEMLHAAAETSRQTGDGYHAALSLLDLSEIYLELNLSSDAREMGEQAITRFRELGMGYEAAKALTNTAIAYGQEGQAFRAIELFTEARAQLVAEKNHVWPSLIDLYQAILLFNEGRLFEARRLCLTAIECFAPSKLASKAAMCHVLLARIAMKMGDPAAAHKSCQDALRELGDVETPILTYHAQLLLGDALSKLGKDEGAYDSYQVAREALETLRSRLRGEDLKIAFVKNKTEVYERLIELCLARDADSKAGFIPDTHTHVMESTYKTNAEEAFVYVEQAKSRSLFDLMFQPVHALAREDASESRLARSIRELREELNWYYNLIEQEQLRPEPESGERIERFQREVGGREKEMARALRELSVSDVQQWELHHPTVSSVDAIRSALPANTVLIEYFQIGDRILLCLVDQTRIEVAPVSVMSSVSNQVRMLQFQLGKFRLGPNYVRTFRGQLLAATETHLHDLFKELLAPVWSELRGKHVVVVPHGVLHYVPFHALYDGEQYVIDACTLSYAPSASIFARCQEERPRSNGPALVLGVPDGQAPFIEDEARTVAAALPASRLFVGSEATEAVLREHAPNSSIVHIASHGYFRPDNPMFSGIRLGDTYLNVYDLYRLRIQADLVTLSGCATGANVAAAGDELLGITRGVLCAGAQTVLLSLWNVHDESTSMFMKSLYGRMAVGFTPAHALRNTMLEVRAEYPHPYYWAPFMLTGKCVQP